jgi:transcriptional regulator GlxA family with amidase domain
MTTTIAVVVWDDMTALDVVGPYDVLATWPDAEIHTVAVRPDPIRTDTGLVLTPTRTLGQVIEPDVALIGGGRGAPDDPAIVDWLGVVDAGATVMASVCTGAGALAAAGLLTGRRATTHWAFREHLATHGVDVRTERVVVDGKYWTAAGVSAGIDLALRLTAEVVGPEHAQTAHLALEYAPEPPFPEAGDPATAPPAVVERLRRALAPTAREVR